MKEVNAVRLRGEAVERRRTHRESSAVSWPMEFGMGPVSVLFFKTLHSAAAENGVDGEHTGEGAR